MNFIDGEILYIDKPYGWTSFDAVKRVRGALLKRMKLKKLKVGHAGTLDPVSYTHLDVYKRQPDTSSDAPQIEVTTSTSRAKSRRMCDTKS